ncbi:MAG: class I SAM-dependent methyltransferase [Candidatus Promineifilaceae bacterium]|nr:class I SAM-dependent methyltransferase [Candidatus Promineifilaceae bacterium]
MDEQNRLKEFVEKYDSGSIPWDDELPPPELIALVRELEPGRALDLGCGYGRGSIFLAGQGWQVDGIDFVPQAIEIAKIRAAKSEHNQNIHFHNASVTDLDFLQYSYDLIVDIGCMHSMSKSPLVKYSDNLLRLARVGGLYLLFAHLGDESDGKDEEIRWIRDEELLALFADGFELLDVEYGETQVEDKPPWKSAWYKFRRISSIS